MPDINANDFAGIEQVTIAHEETLFHADARASSIFFIHSGFVKLVRDSRTSRKRTVRIVKSGGAVGIEALFAPSPGHTAIAVGKVVACKVPAATVRRMADAVSAVQRRLLEYSHQTLMRAETWLAEFAGGNARSRERMACLLLHLSDGNSNRVPRLGLGDIGSLLGITVETACRNLSELTRLGLVEKCRQESSLDYYRVNIAGLEEVAYAKESESRRSNNVPRSPERIPANIYSR